ncbi:hypothetical protein WJ976_19035 [Achromobacter denitrificans]
MPGPGFLLCVAGLLRGRLVARLLVGLAQVRQHPFLFLPLPRQDLVLREKLGDLLVQADDFLPGRIGSAFGCVMGGAAGSRRLQGGKFVL